MAVFSTVIDPGMARAIRSGRKTQMRVCAGSPLSRCVPGDQIRLREACIPGRVKAGRDHFCALRKAEFVIFADGWRQYADGSGHPGRRPGNSEHRWVAAVHMPDWACRTTITVEWIRTERLQKITTPDIKAEGVLPLVGGWLWRLPAPIPGLYRKAEDAFSSYWDIVHGTSGERWEDDPLVAVIGFRPVASSSG